MQNSLGRFTDTIQGLLKSELPPHWTFVVFPPSTYSLFLWPWYPVLLRVHLFSILWPCVLWFLHDFHRQSMSLRLNQSVNSTSGDWVKDSRDQHVTQIWSTRVNEIDFCGFSGTVGKADSLSCWASSFEHEMIESLSGSQRMEPADRAKMRSGERQ